MTRPVWRSRPRRGLAVPLLLLAAGLGSQAWAQEPFYSPQDAPLEQAPALLSPDQLTDLVAPIALYPDPLLSQVLVVSTYPQQLAEAEQWLEQNGNLNSSQLIYAARQQDWDPSVQALVAFPGVMALLASNMQWTADLGQAFLAQPADVMNAVQYLRGQARANGQLRDTPQLSIHNEFQDGQSAIEILPANPEIMYVPAYDPYAVWGPPAAGSYPSLSYAGSALGPIIGTAINLAEMFVGFHGLLNPGGWGWALSWLAHTLFVNNSFLSDFGFRTAGGGFDGSAVWVHDGGYGGRGALASNGGGWRGFGSGGWRMFSGASSGTRFRPQRWGASEGFPAGNFASRGGNWRSFGGAPARAPAYQTGGHFASRSWSGNRGFQASNRGFTSGGRFGASASDRGAFRNWQTRAPSNSGFRGSSSGRGRSMFGSGRSPGRSWSHPFRSSQPRMDSGRGSESRGFSPHFRAPKAPRMPRQHFSAPRFKSHGGSPHFSRGHSGGKSHRRR